MSKKAKMSQKLGIRLYPVDRVLAITDNFIKSRCSLHEFAHDWDIPLSSLRMVLKEYLPKVRGGKKRTKVVNKIIETHYRINCEVGGREYHTKTKLLRQMESFCVSAGF